MGKAQKKFGKGRLDHYYRLAKEKGYRARSSFKIIQINQKFGHFLENSKCVIDLCAAPGSWCQVASNLCAVNSLIIGVDLAPIKPLPNVITFQSDITTDHCRQQLRGYMKTWKADTVMHDGAPNVGMAWTQDAFTQSELTLQSLKLAVEFLIKGGVFVTKVFRSKDYNSLLWVFQQFFERVEATKPPSSRNVSAEIFVVCRGFKAPKKIDPRLLDPKYVFEELQDPNPNYNAKIFNPEKKIRKRDGYEENDYTQFHTMSALEFIKHLDPIQCLGSMNELTFDVTKEPELKPIKKLKETTDELLECFKDLKVLGKKEFRNILKWRKRMREYLELDDKEEDEEKTVEVEELDEEEKINRELQELQEKEIAKKKREQRKSHEQKQKEMRRMQMGFMRSMDIGIEAGQQGGESLFNLKHAERTGKLNALAKGKKSMVFSKEDVEREGDWDFGGDDENAGEQSDDYVENLDEQLDSMYQSYKERQAERDSKYEAKLARQKDGDDEFTGFSDREESDDDSAVELDSDSEFSDDEEEEQLDKLITSLRESSEPGLSRKAAMFFDDDLFDDVDEAPSDGNSNTQTSGTVANGNAKANSATVNGKANGTTANGNGNDKMDVDEESSDEDTGFEVVANEDNDSDWDSDNDGKNPSVDIVTAEAMTLAHQLALGQTNKHKLIDESYNKYSFRDQVGLPEWFVDDERKHSKISKPITKEAAEAIREKLKALNARPIKKVQEAQARKKYKMQKKLEKIRKKSELLLGDTDKSEREKAEDIAKLMKKAGTKKVKPKVKLIAAKGFNKGLQGRPKGVKGRYKMVDGTMKKEQRSLRRIEKKKTKGRR
ncbi:27S pre-rRNA (guanosine(2922)-2'-O)-methyltransferase [Trichomonascus vanleenenianus]|uniref:27S pre-rRNA (guanosine2922-2'-O)-methyltransferase n=1 Tax=Trichomonascus vanleenenianus TaxID=2268995 RepID=UPI003ECA4E86